MWTLFISLLIHCKWSFYLADQSTNVFLLGNPSNALTLEAKTFKINPPTDTEKKDVKWIIHDSNNKLYVPDGEVIINENKNPQKPYIHKWDFYDVPIP